MTEEQLQEKMEARANHLTTVAEARQNPNLRPEWQNVPDDELAISINLVAKLPDDDHEALIKVMQRYARAHAILGRILDGVDAIEDEEPNGTPFAAALEEAKKALEGWV